MSYQKERNTNISIELKSKIKSIKRNVNAATINIIKLNNKIFNLLKDNEKYSHYIVNKKTYDCECIVEIRHKINCLYKKKMCKNRGHCKYSIYCIYAHSTSELKS